MNEATGKITAQGNEEKDLVDYVRFPNINYGVIASTHIRTTGCLIRTFYEWPNWQKIMQSPLQRNAKFLVF